MQDELILPCGKVLIVILKHVKIFLTKTYLVLLKLKTKVIFVFLSNYLYRGNASLSYEVIILYR